MKDGGVLSAVGVEILREREREREREDKGMLPICIVPYTIILMSISM